MENPYECICTHSFLVAGCTCGAWTAAQADEAALIRAEGFAAAERKRAYRDFLIPEPTKPITFRKCATCGAGDCACAESI